MRLYEIPKDSIIECEVSDGSKYLQFYHVDGSYSYCVSEKGALCHLYAMTELVHIKDNRYKLKKQD